MFEQAIPRILAFQRLARFEIRDTNTIGDGDGYFDGLTGASRAHNLIAEIFREIRSQLKGRRCEVNQESMRVRTPSRLFTYPDVVAVCGEPRFDDIHFDTL